MDHQAALDQHLTEKYLLGELGDAEAAEFEEHFFECEICAKDVVQASRFAANLKAVLREENTALEVRPHHQFVDLTIRLRAAPLSPVECEFQGQDASSAVVVAQAVGKSIHLHLPVSLLQEGSCTVILRDRNSRDELERRRITIKVVRQP